VHDRTVAGWVEPFARGIRPNLADERDGSSSRAFRRRRRAIILTGGFPWRRRRDLFPPIARSYRVTQAGEKLLFCKIMFPAAAVVKLDEIRPSPLREPAPLVRDFRQRPG